MHTSTPKDTPRLQLLSLLLTAASRAAAAAATEATGEDLDRPTVLIDCTPTTPETVSGGGGVETKASTLTTNDSVVAAQQRSDRNDDDDHETGRLTQLQKLVMLGHRREEQQ